MKNQEEFMKMENYSDQNFQEPPQFNINPPNLKEQLYNSYVQYMRTVKKKTKLENFLSKMVRVLDLLWKQLVPQFIYQIHGDQIDFPINYLHQNLQILQGSFESNLQMCKQSSQIFVVFGTGLEGRLHQSHLEILTEISNKFLVIPLKKVKKDQKYFKYFYQEDNFNSKSSELIFCRFNIAEEIVVFGQIDLNTDRSSFKLLCEGICLQEKEYQELQRRCERRYLNEEIKKEKEMTNLTKKQKQEEMSGSLELQL